MLFKRVSKEWLTQEGTDNETAWAPGSQLTHLAWSPESEECGGGKFHACHSPAACDEFRSTEGDRYVAIRVKVCDLYAWIENPSYPSKIAFRGGHVLYEVDRFGDRIVRDSA